MKFWGLYVEKKQNDLILNFCFCMQVRILEE